MESNLPEGTPADAGKPEKRSPRSIRFHDAEWARIEAFAETRGLAAAEYVRFAALAAIGDESGGLRGSGRLDRLVPLIERTFRYGYMIATKMRDDMLNAGQDEELEALVEAARALQTGLLTSDPE